MEGEAKIKDLKKKGNACFSNKNYSDAIKYYKKGLELDSKNQQLIGNLAHAYLEVKNFESAEQYAKMVIADSKNCVKGYFRAAKAAEGLGDRIKAIEYCKQGLGNCPESSELDSLKQLINKLNQEDSSNSNRERVASQSCQEDGCMNEEPPSLVSDSDSDDSNDFNDKLRSRSTTRISSSTVTSDSNKASMASHRSMSTSRTSSKESENKTLSKKHRRKQESLEKLPFIKTLEDLKKELNVHQITPDQLWSKKRNELQVILKEGSHLMANGLSRKALDKYKVGLEIMLDNLEELKLKDIDILVLKYSLCVGWIELASYADIVKAVENLKEIEANRASKFPAVFYGLGSAYYKLNRYKVATEHLEKGLLFLKREVKFEVQSWPGTNTIIPETTRHGLEELLKELHKTCRTYHEPDAICRYKQCLSLSSHIIPSEHIFYSDPEFSGFVIIMCEEKCRIEYHLGCWKEYKESESPNEIGKMSDKDFIGRCCPTRDCLNQSNERSSIVKIEIIGDDGSVKTSIEAPKMEAAVTVKEHKKTKKKQKNEKPIEINQDKPKIKPRRKTKKSTSEPEPTTVSQDAPTSNSADELEPRLRKLEKYREAIFHVNNENHWDPQQKYYGREDIQSLDNFLNPEFIEESESVKAKKDFLFSYFYEFIRNEGPQKIKEVERKWQAEVGDFEGVGEFIDAQKSICKFLLQSYHFATIDDYICLAEQLPETYSMAKTELVESLSFMLTGLADCTKPLGVSSDDRVPTQDAVSTATNKTDQAIEPHLIDKEGQEPSNPDPKNPHTQNNSISECNKTEDPCSSPDIEIIDTVTKQIRLISESDSLISYEDVESYTSEEESDNDSIVEDEDKEEEQNEEVEEENVKSEHGSANNLNPDADVFDLVTKDLTDKVESETSTETKTLSEIGETFVTTSDSQGKSSAAKVTYTKLEQWSLEDGKSSIPKSEKWSLQGGQLKNSAVNLTASYTINPNLPPLVAQPLPHFTGSFVTPIAAPFALQQQTAFPVQQQPVNSTDTASQTDKMKDWESDIHKLEDKVKSLEKQVEKSTLEKEKSKKSYESKLEQQDKKLKQLDLEMTKTTELKNKEIKILQDNLANVQSDFEEEKRKYLKEKKERDDSENNTKEMMRNLICETGQKVKELEEELAQTQQHVGQYQELILKTENELVSFMNLYKQKCLDKLQTMKSKLKYVSDTTIPTKTEVSSAIKNWVEYLTVITEWEVKLKVHYTIVSEKTGSITLADFTSLQWPEISDEPDCPLLMIDEFTHKVLDETRDVREQLVAKDKALTQLKSEQQKVKDELSANKAQKSFEPFQMLEKLEGFAKRFESPNTKVEEKLEQKPEDKQVTSIVQNGPQNAFGFSNSTMLKSSMSLFQPPSPRFGSQYMPSPATSLFQSLGSTSYMPFGQQQIPLHLQPENLFRNVLGNNEMPHGQPPTVETKSTEIRPPVEPSALPKPNTVQPVEVEKQVPEKLKSSSVVAGLTPITPTTTSAAVTQPPLPKVATNLLMSKPKLVAPIARPTEAPKPLMQTFVPPPPNLAQPLKPKAGRSYQNLMTQLRKNFPTKTEDELADSVSLVRARNNNSLSGLTVPNILVKVDNVLKEKEKSSKKQGSMGLDKFGGNAWGGLKESTTNWSKPKDSGDEDCIICMEAMDKEQKTALHCKHTFHTKCIRQWLRTESICPICRLFTRMADEFPPLS